MKKLNFKKLIALGLTAAAAGALPPPCTSTNGSRMRRSDRFIAFSFLLIV